METTLHDLHPYLDKLLNAYSHNYDISHDVDVDGYQYPATATYYLRDENYLISRKHVLNALEQHEYVYFYLCENLSAELLHEQIEITLNAGMKQIKPHKEHMSSYVTLVILAKTIDVDAKKLLKKTHYRKNFRLALHGWMEYHIAAMETSTMSFFSNLDGREARKTLELNFDSHSSKRKKKGE